MRRTIHTPAVMPGWSRRVVTAVLLALVGLGVALGGLDARPAEASAAWHVYGRVSCWPTWTPTRVKIWTTNGVTSAAVTNGRYSFTFYPNAWGLNGRAQVTCASLLRPQGATDRCYTDYFSGQRASPNSSYVSLNFSAPWGWHACR